MVGLITGQVPFTLPLNGALIKTISRASVRRSLAFLGQFVVVRGTDRRAVPFVPLVHRGEDVSRRLTWPATVAARELKPASSAPRAADSRRPLRSSCSRETAAD
jgi:hypothetical protein